MKPSSPSMTGAALLLVLVLTSSPARAANYWKNSVTTGAWSTGSNWSSISNIGSDNAGAPIMNEAVNIVLTDGGTHTVTYDVSAPPIGVLSIDLTDGNGIRTSTLSISSNNALTTNGIVVGGYNGAATTNGRGSLIQSAGTVTTSPVVGDLIVGWGGNSLGTYTLSGGAFVNTLNEYIGFSGKGVFNHSGGTNTINASATGVFSLAHNLNSTGEYNLSGAGALSTDANQYIGYSGRGTFTQTGGTNTISAAGKGLYLGYTGFGFGAYDLAAGTVTVPTPVVVGRAGYGEMFLKGGTLAICGGTLPLQIATLAGSNGTVYIGGAAAVLQASAVQFGLGTGQLAFYHDDNLTFTTPITGNGFVTAGSGGAGTGTTTLSASNSYTGLTRVSGGTLAVSEDANLGTAPASFKANQIEFTGGTLRATASFTLAANRGIAVANLSLGSIEVDATKTLTYPNSFSLSSGRMTKTGAGALSVRNVSIDGSASTEFIVTGGGTLITVLDGVISSGTATVRGVGSTWNVGDDLSIGSIAGHLAIGTLNIEERALVYVGGAFDMFAESIVNLSGGTFRTNGYVRSAASTFNFNSGTIQLAGNRTVGTDAAIADLLGAVPAIATGKGLTVEGTATLSKPLTIEGGKFTANGVIIGVGGAIDFDRGVLELTGGTIMGLASLAVPTNGELRARGVQAFRIAGATGSGITATGNLTLGDAAAVNGFYTNGTLGVGDNVVTLSDANDAAFDTGSLATLGAGGAAGALAAANGLTLDFGGNITGFGTINTPNSSAKPLINNGHMTGDVGAPITLTGYVKGVGTIDNVVVTGTDAPGFSPATVVRGSVVYKGTLQIEIGGTSLGSFDRLEHVLGVGVAQLGGSLNVSLLGGFEPELGDTFEFLTATGGVSGTFATEILPTLAAGLGWNVAYGANSVLLRIAAAPNFLEADFDEDHDVDGNDLARWRTGFGTGTTHMQGNADGDGDVDGEDFLVWQRQLGSPMTIAAASASATAVPEPTSAGLLLASACLLFASKRRAQFC